MGMGMGVGVGGGGTGLLGAGPGCVLDDVGVVGAVGAAVVHVITPVVRGMALAVGAGAAAPARPGASADQPK